MSSRVQSPRPHTTCTVDSKRRATVTPRRIQRVAMRQSAAPQPAVARAAIGCGLTRQHIGRSDRWVNDKRRQKSGSTRVKNRGCPLRLCALMRRFAVQRAFMLLVRQRSCNRFPGDGDGRDTTRRHDFQPLDNHALWRDRDQFSHGTIRADDLFGVCVARQQARCMLVIAINLAVAVTLAPARCER